MTRTRAAVLTAPGGPFTIEEIEVEAPRGDEVLVRLIATGVCHTDLTVRAGGVPFPLPGVLGHEGAGVVQQVGREVTDVRPGDKVVLSFSSCGTCAGCGSNRPAYCATWLARNLMDGARSDGTSPLSTSDGPVGGHFFGQSSFAEHAVVQRRGVVVVDPDADLTVLAPLGCGVMTGFGSVWNVLAPPPGARLAVLGTGAVGLSAVVAARLCDPEILVAVDVVPARLDLARELGATHVVHAGKEDVVAAVTEATGGRGLTGAFDTSGDPALCGAGLELLAPTGHLVTCGAPPPGTVIRADIQSLLPGRTLSGVTMGDADPADLVPRLVALHRLGVLPLDRWVRHYPVDQIDQAFTDMRDATVVKPVILHQP